MTTDTTSDFNRLCQMPLVCDDLRPDAPIPDLVRQVMGSIERTDDND